MPKLVLLTAILSTFFLAASSQKLTEYGIHGGLNFNSGYGSSFINNAISRDVGFSVGGHIKVKTASHFGIKAILQYEQNGWAYRSLTFENSTGTGLVKADIITKIELSKSSFAG